MKLGIYSWDYPVIRIEINVNSLIVFIKYVIFHCSAQSHVPSSVKMKKIYISEFIEEEKILSSEGRQVEFAPTQVGRTKSEQGYECEQP